MGDMVAGGVVMSGRDTHTGGSSGKAATIGTSTTGTSGMTGSAGTVGIAGITGSSSTLGSGSTAATGSVAEGALESLAVGIGAGPPAPAGHVQVHIQSHAHVRGVWLRVVVDSDVVLPQWSNVHVQAHAPLASPPWAGAGAGAAASPGRGSIDGLISLAPPASAVAPFASAVSQLQSHIQFHVQSSDAALPVSVDDVMAFPKQSKVRFQRQTHGSSRDCSKD